MIDVGCAAGIGVRARPNLGGRHLFARKKFSLPEFWAFFAQKISRLGGAETLFARTFCPKIVYLLHKFWQFCPKIFFLGGLPPPPPAPLARTLMAAGAESIDKKYQSSPLRYLMMMMMMM